MEGVLVTILCFGILSVLIALLFRGNNKPKQTEQESPQKNYVDLFIEVNQEVINPFSEHKFPEVSDVITNKMIMILQREKALSYKEGFWNGQKAKIEEVKFSDKDTLSKEEIEDIKKSLKQQDYTNPLS